MTHRERTGKTQHEQLPTGLRTGHGRYPVCPIPVWIGVVTTLFALSASSTGTLVAKQVQAVTGEQFADSLGNVGPSWYDKTNDRAVWPAAPHYKPPVSAGRTSIPTTPMQQPARAASSSFNLDWLGPWTTWILLSILFLLLAGLAFWVLSRMKPDLDIVGLSSKGVDDRNRIEHLPFEMDLTIRDFRAAALAAAQEKNFRQAIIFLYSHALVMLDKNKVIHLRKGKTNRQYLGEVLQRIPREAGFRSLMQDFEAVFFGNHLAIEHDFERVFACANSIENLALQAGPGGNL